MPPDRVSVSPILFLLQTQSASIVCNCSRYGRSFFFLTGVRTKTSPFSRVDLRLRSWIPAKFKIPATSQSVESAHRRHSASVFFSHASASSSLMPRMFLSILERKTRPVPTMLVTFVLIAPVARGLFLIKSLDLSRRSGSSAIISVSASPALTFHSARGRLLFEAPL